jgi:hypothetical protein
MSVVHNRKNTSGVFSLSLQNRNKEQNISEKYVLDLGLKSFKLWFRVSVVGEEIVQKIVCGSVQKGSASAADNRKAPQSVFSEPKVARSFLPNKE